MLNDLIILPPSQTLEGRRDRDLGQTSEKPQRRAAAGPGARQDDGVERVTEVGEP